MFLFYILQKCPNWNNIIREDLYPHQILGPYINWSSCRSVLGDLRRRHVDIIDGSKL
jgi:hypothetical protein